MSIGLAAVAAGGTSIVTNGSSGASNVLGNAISYIDDYDGSDVTITNDGSVLTFGAASHGIVALSAGGGGGLINVLADTEKTALGSQTSNSGGGDGGSVTVSNTGVVTTGSSARAAESEAAIGIVAQSIGGGGGSSGASVSLIGANDASGSGGGNGGAVAVHAKGDSAISTFDSGAIGILAQSVGGGGGNGSNSYGEFAAVGGAGGNGGHGGDVTVDIAGASGLVTRGHFAAGVISQSIGGGGGNGGSGDAFGSILADSIGGTGGNGGDAGKVQVGNASSITTVGNQSWGIIAQSVGGGGGTGGSANSYSASVITISLAMGGSGGEGGKGSDVEVANSGTIQTGCNEVKDCIYTYSGGPTLDGANATGILAQSIGGGGGTGGAASAKSLSFPTDEFPSLSLSFAVGGSGGKGGDGGGVTVSNVGTVATSGDASFGINAQSIGGGGGNGGDATAAAYGIEGEMPSLKLAIAIGGTGGGGGTGSAVTVKNGLDDSCAVCGNRGTIATYGNDATGIVAQSIGGGGGTGGSGNASASSPNLGDDTGKAIDLTIGVGGTGGTGNTGGAVTVVNKATGYILTQGSTSKAILAQSIGGGGGAATGGQASSSGDTFDGNLTIGGNGGSGNDGGTVNVTNGGVIVTGLANYTNEAGLTITTGGDSIGILAQSIGGGGGVGGSSDPSANIGVAGQIEDGLAQASNSYSADIAIGGKGGAGGAGGTVTVTNSGTVTTYGLRAFGIEAQSIGGGGGNGGLASATSNGVLTDIGEAGKDGTYSANISLGGNAGEGSDGGTVSLTNSGSVLTAGYGAHGVLLQSVGGGGGVGAEGTVDTETTIGLGFGDGGNSGSGGNGGSISLAADSGLIVTAGNDAYGVLAQSVGGGGGLASSGCSNPGISENLQGVTASSCLGADSISYDDSPWKDENDVSITLGGNAGADGDGGAISITKTDGLIFTSGARSFGIFAQSIGGGGGIAAGDDSNVSSVKFSSGQSGSIGGDISVSVEAGAGIATTGDGSFGIFAQSIGGSGGFAGDSSLDPVFTRINNLPLSYTGSQSAGGNITIDIAGKITTTGTNAHGVVLQSSGSGGGVIGVDGQLVMSIGTGDYASGDGGTIVFTQDAGSTITASGFNANGILVQSAGSSTQESGIALTIGGAVVGGTYLDDSQSESSTAAGILVSGGVALNAAGEETNKIIISTSGSVSNANGASGTAILSADGRTTVANGGTVTGAVLLYDTFDNANPATNATFQNLAGGTFNAGSVSVLESIQNEGTINPGGKGTFQSYLRLNGDFVQSDSGVFAVDIDTRDRTNVSDLLVVRDGNAVLDGFIDPKVSAILPQTYSIFEVSNGYNLSGSAGVIDNSIVFDWNRTFLPTQVQITPSADFLPSGANLNENETSIAYYLQRSWNAIEALSNPSADYGEMSAAFGLVYNDQTAASYAETLDTLSGQTSAFNANDQALSGRSGLDSAFSCPTFSEDSGTLLGETSCIWSKAMGSSIKYGGPDALPDRHIATQGLRVGGQAEIADDWFLGATAAYSTVSSKAQGATASSTGDLINAEVAIKHVEGPWYFGIGAGIGFGWYDNQRLVNVQGTPVTINSDFDTVTVGGRFRMQYEMAFANWYLRPRTDFDVMYTHVPSYGEEGPAGLALDVLSQDEITLAFSPNLEIGGRLALENGWTLRPYTGLGFVAMSNDEWITTASLRGAPASAGTFQIGRHVPDLVGRLDLGLDLQNENNFSARFEYGLQFGSEMTSNTAALRLGLEF